MTSESASASTSVSDCCLPTTCACADWLTIFCDYETVAVTYCGVTNEYSLGRSRDMPQASQNPNAGVFPSDRMFEVSMQEIDMAVGIGATVVDSDETEWIVYKVQNIRTFCTKRLWCRSIAACFALLDTIEIYDRVASNEACGVADEMTLIGCVKGNIRAERGSVTSRNDTTDVIAVYGGNLVRWPVEDQLPSGHHRIKVKDGCDLYRITSFVDDGLFSPYRLVLEKDGADCSV